MSMIVKEMKSKLISYSNNGNTTNCVATQYQYDKIGNIVVNDTRPLCFYTIFPCNL